MTRLRRFLEDQTGATAIEQAILVAVIGITLIVAVRPVMEKSASFSDILNDAFTGSGTITVSNEEEKDEEADKGSP